MILLDSATPGTTQDINAEENAAIHNVVTGLTNPNIHKCVLRLFVTWDGTSRTRNLSVQIKDTGGEVYHEDFVQAVTHYASSDKTIFLVPILYDESNGLTIKVWSDNANDDNETVGYEMYSDDGEYFEDFRAAAGSPTADSRTERIKTTDDNVTTLIGRITAALFSGITSLAEWLGAMAGSHTADTTALGEINATGPGTGSGTFDEAVDSQEAIADGGSGGGTTPAAVWSYGTRVLTAGTNIGTVAANVTQVSGNADAANNLELQYDELGGLTGNTFPATQLQITSGVDLSAAAKTDIAQIVERTTGTVWYVATAANGGNDSNSGLSPDLPFLTPKKACETNPPGAGDTVIIGAGTYVLGVNVLDVVNGVSVYGAGMDNTLIQSTAELGTDGCIIKPGSNATVADMTIHGTLTGGEYQACFGSNNDASQAVVVNAVGRNLRMIADTDGTYLDQTSASSIKLFDCVTETKWDGLVSWGSIGSPNIVSVEATRCDINVTGPTNVTAANGGGLARGVVSATGSLVRLTDCHVRVVDGALRTGGIESQVASTVEMYGGSIYTEQTLTGITLTLNHGGITGTLSAADGVTGQTSGATGTLSADPTSSVITIKSITGTFETGEQIAKTGDEGNFVTSTSTPFNPVFDVTGGQNPAIVVGVEYDRSKTSGTIIHRAADARDVVLQTTIATLASQTSFTLGNGSANDDAYNNLRITVENATGGVQKAVGIASDYTGATKTVTLAADPGIFTMAPNDIVTIYANTGQTGDSFARIGAPAATVSADIAAVKTETAQIASDLPSTITKNTALADFPFFMVLAADHFTGATGKTVVAQRSIDGGAFGNCTNTPATEIANGIYKISLTAADLNGDTICLKFTNADCDSRILTIVTKPT